MIRGGVLLLFLTLLLFGEVEAQGESTRIMRIEVDGKQIHKSFNVFFLKENTWIRASATSRGFQIPEILKYEEFLDVSIRFGKYRLDFSKIHISKFRSDWIVGVDKEPFSDEYVRSNDVENTKLAFYIKFLGAGLATQVVVREPKL